MENLQDLQALKELQREENELQLKKGKLLSNLKKELTKEEFETNLENLHIKKTQANKLIKIAQDWDTYSNNAKLEQIILLQKLTIKERKEYLKNNIKDKALEEIEQDIADIKANKKTKTDDYASIVKKENNISKKIEKLEEEKKKVLIEKYNASKNLTDTEIILEEEYIDNGIILSPDLNLLIYIKRDTVKELIYKLERFNTGTLEETINTVDKARSYNYERFGDMAFKFELTDIEFDKLKNKIIEYFPIWKEHQQNYIKINKDKVNATIEEGFRACLPSVVMPATDNEIATEIIKAGYKTLAKKEHPDMGGNEDQFVNLTNTKDTLLNIFN